LALSLEFEYKATTTLTLMHVICYSFCHSVRHFQHNSKEFPYLNTDKIDRMIKRSSHGCFHIMFSLMFSHRPYIKVVISPRLSPRADNRRSTLIYGPIWKQPCDNL